MESSTQELKGALPVFNINVRYNQFKEAVDRVLNGEWTPEEFGAWLGEMTPRMLEKGRKTMEDLEEWGYTRMAPEECAEGFQGIELYERGMDEMALFLEDGDAQHLHDGLALCLEGNQKVNKAMLMNRDAYEELEINFNM
ncbi:MAG: hypothetical protein AB1758_11865 [Candidatus Eremiobacterota bacterium]